MPEREMPDQVGHDAETVRHDVKTVINDDSTSGTVIGKL